jgi:serine phosphatase RsbU (regulator of sigma subunit)
LKRRVALVLLITLLFAGGVIVYSAGRLRYWHRMGVAGLNYFPVTGAEAKQSKMAFGFKPGGVLIVYGWSGAEQAGVRTRDEVVSINGIPVNDVTRLRVLDRRARSGDVLTYRVKRDNRVLDLPVRITSPLANPMYLVTFVVRILVASVFVLIGLLVFTRRTDDRRVAVFYAMVMIGAVSLLAPSLVLLDGAALRGIAGAQQSLVPTFALFAASFAFVPIALHLALVFPRERPVLQKSPRVLRWVYGLPIVAALLFATIAVAQSVLAAKESASDQIDLALKVGSGALALIGMGAALWVVRKGRGEGWRAFWNRPIAALFAMAGVLLGAIHIVAALKWKYVALGIAIFTAVAPILVVAAFPILTCIALYRSYREAGPEERRQVKWPLWGTLIALMTKIMIFILSEVIALYLLSSGASMREWMHAADFVGAIPVLAYLLIPISFAFAILKYRLMNIDIIIRKTVAYAFLTGAIVVMYLVLVGGIGTLLVSVAGVRNQTMVIASTLVVALVVVPLRNKLQTLVDRNLFPHKYDYPAALRAVSGDTLTANDLGAFLTSAAEKMQHALQNRAVVIFVTRNEEFVAAAKVGLADSVIGSMRMRRAPLLPLDRPFDPTRHELPDDAMTALKRMEAVLIVPINTPGTPANGFIALAAKLNSNAFDVEDIDFLRSVADQLDIGIDRIRQQREEADYEQARAIQESLLPREMPRVAGLDLSGTWQPARSMGGDYYDVLKLSESELAVCIGDVAGKGMSAALLMSGLQAAVRASASGSPRDLCERVRRVVVSSLTGGRFVTFFYATIDVASMRLRWCNAGHNAPVLMRADGSVERLSEGGPAFSRLLRNDPYTEKEIAINAGDRLVLFTDGVSEAAGGDGEMFGEQRIEELVSAHRHASAEELQQRIADAATHFSGGELADDLTLVVVAITPPA